MAARPNPVAALRVCVTLAKNSVTRLENVIAVVDWSLKNNVRLSAGDINYYQASLTLARDMLKKFSEIAAMKPPKPPPKRAVKRGRPSQVEIDKARRRNS